MKKTIKNYIEAIKLIGVTVYLAFTLPDEAWED